ncbi:ClbS/DfsB family four-helix bundle protein [Devriesea agamarum]|uniref:ClbS/DfsB family four-helix bundle protein n=1 Tax=Devriesea agamarum TaxID=472569 RepID=UPI00071DEFEB|nr:ClbS/DfsB family four-helix bundle protein [Devriesea agamarum]
MPRPTTKVELLSAATSSFTKLTTLWDSLSAEQARKPFPQRFREAGSEAHWRRDTCLRDVVVHLHEWHNLVLTWVAANRNGTPAGFFPAPYTWRNYAGLNELFAVQHRNTTYEHARELLAASHHDIVAVIESFSDEELFTKKYFLWTGTTSLGSYLVSATSSHYEWAAKKTRAYVKALKS